MKKYLLVLFFPVLFLLMGLLTISDYGINFDEPFHFNRGQAYLHFLLTSKHNYLDLPAYPEFRGSSDFMGREGESDLFLNSKISSIAPDPGFRRSYFQSDVFNYEYFRNNDGGGHPATNDLLAATFNYIFYQKLGVLEDIEGHHLFEIFVSFLLVLALSIFTYKNFGLLVSLVSSFALASYPLFFSESHFNIKDPVEASFFGLTIIFFYFGITKNKWKLILVSSFFAGLALGTKFNILFAPFIIIPWLAFYCFQNTKKILIKKSILVSLFFYPLLTFFIFYITWPYLWQNTLESLKSVVEFYKQSGTSLPSELFPYVRGGFNLFPITWITITTPLPVLFLGLMGLVISLKEVLLKKSHLHFLIILWLLIPILRVTLPGTGLHSGVRHIMEFISALAILSGIGSFYLYSKVVPKYQKGFLISLALVLLFGVLDVIRLHPNENVYFNQLIGGLSGARDKNIPFWGNSYGNAYLQGVNWLNENAEPNAKVGLPIFNMVNVPRVKLRSDIDFSNAHVSGPNLQGEYVMEMSHNFRPESWYSYSYYDTYLNPVYEVKVDNVPILKIWKNDEKNLKGSEIKEEELLVEDLKIDSSKISIDLGKQVNITRLQIIHDDQNCQKQKGGYISLSIDGKNFIQESENIDYPQLPTKWLGSNNNTFVFMFSAKKARYIFLDTQMSESCILKNPKLQILGFDS